jgi:hypothetical protein
MTAPYLSQLRDLRAYVAPCGRRDALAPIDRAIAVLTAAPEHVHARLAAAVVVLYPALAPILGASRIRPICPAYPQADLVAQARLALGERPVDIMPGLTAREAHEALAAGYDNPTAWLLRDLPRSVRARDVAVARWVLACWTDPERRAALENERVERIAGAEVRGRFLDRLDEIRAVDLDQGPRTSVRRAFERASQRLYAEWAKRSEDDHSPLAPIPRWWVPARCARVLRTRAALIAEGREMQHCVGTYAPLVARGDCVIVAIMIRAGGRTLRSTVELDPHTVEVRQHRGPGNAEPHPLCQRALRVLQRRWQARLGVG